VLPFACEAGALAVSRLVLRLGMGAPMRDSTGRSGGWGSVGIYSDKTLPSLAQN
jgi:hypothetical protein